MMFMTHLFVSSCSGRTLNCQNTASSAVSVSAEQNPLGKRLNSQTKFLLMKLWDYFEQEARKSKVSFNVKQRISKATGIKYLLCNWV